jgi:hypothetical protein
MGSRTVTAHRVALLVDAATLAWISADPSRRESLRDAFAAVMRTPETELADLSVVLQLPAVGGSWQHAYRDAPVRATPERLSEQAVLLGAAAFAEVLGEQDVSATLRRAELEVAEVAGSAEALLRIVVRLDPADLVKVRRDPGLEERIRRVVKDAGTRATAAIATVELGARLFSARTDDGGAESRLVRALEAKGATVVPVSRQKGRSVLGVVVDGRLARAEVVERGSGTSSDMVSVPRFVIAAESLGDAAEADAVSAAVLAAVASTPKR